MSGKLTCPACGEEVAPDSNFCTRCGTRLTPVPAPASDGAASAPSQESAKAKPRVSWRSVLTYIGGGCAMFAALLRGHFYVLPRLLRERRRDHGAVGHPRRRPVLLLRRRIFRSGRRPERHGPDALRPVAVLQCRLRHAARGGSVHRRARPVHRHARALYPELLSADKVRHLHGGKDLLCLPRLCASLPRVAGGADPRLYRHGLRRQHEL